MRTPEEQRQAHHVHCENLRSVLAHLVNTQFEIIVDLVLRDEAELRDMLRVLESRPMYVVGVRAPLEVLEERERLREDRGAGMAREQSAHPAFGRDYDLVIDTSEKYCLLSRKAVSSLSRQKLNSRSSRLQRGLPPSRIAE